MPQGDEERAAEAGRSAEHKGQPLTAPRSPVEQEGESADAPPHGTLSADRLRDVLERLRSNFYDRPEVRDQIARGLAQDLGSQPTE